MKNERKIKNKKKINKCNPFLLGKIKSFKNKLAQCTNQIFLSVKLSAWLFRGRHTKKKKIKIKKESAISFKEQNFKWK